MHIWVVPNIHRHGRVKDFATLNICVLFKDSDKEASLVVIVRVKPHAPGQIQWIAHKFAALLIVVIGVIFVEHSFAEGV